MNATSSAVRVGMAITLALTLTGCGEPKIPRAAVQGMISVDGEPLPKGRILFAPSGEQAAWMCTLPVVGGKFEAPATTGPVVGEHRIEIVSTDDGGFAPDDEAAMDRWVAEGKKPLKIVKVPDRYSKDSDLKATVTADGPNEFRFALESKPPK